MAFSSRTTKITGEHIHLSALFLFAFIVLMVFRIKTPDDGDTYAYANSISTFAGPVIHFGYFVVGFLLHSFLQKIGVNALQTLGYMSVLFGSLSVACIYLFTLELTGDRIQGLLAGLVLLFSGTFWLFAEHGEVYVPQLAIILLATIAMLKRRPFMASIFFLIAMSITPTSCLVFPPLLYIAHYRGLTKKDVAWFAIPAFCSLFLVFLLAFHQVVAIMKWATYSPRVFFSNLTVREGVITLIYQLLVVYLKPFNVCIAFAAVGAFYLYRHDKKIFFLMVWFMLPFIAYIFNLGLISGDHLIITFIVVSFLVSYLLSRLLQAKDGNIAVKWGLVLALFSVHIFSSYSLILGPESRNGRELYRVAMMLADQYEPRAVTYSQYNLGMALWYLTQSEQNFLLFTGRPDEFLTYNCPRLAPCINRLNERFWINLPHIPGFMAQQIDHKRLMSGRTIYVIDRSDWPTSIIRLLLPKRELEKKKQIKPRIERAVAYIEKYTGLNAEARKIIDSPLYPVYAVALYDR